MGLAAAPAGAMALSPLAASLLGGIPPHKRPNSSRVKEPRMPYCARVHSSFVRRFPENTNR